MVNRNERSDRLSPLKRLQYGIVSAVPRLAARIRYGRQYETPVYPDRLIWIDPNSVVHKPAEKPKTSVLPPKLVVNGSWDVDLIPIQEDVVFRTFRERFVNQKPWRETGYVEFIRTNVSEHGNVSKVDARKRCETMDALYEYIETHGYRSQSDLERDGDLLGGGVISRRPPAYREVAVNVTRDGEFVWHAGMHRLVIAQLLDIERIPVRINGRHEEWQTIRERAYNELDFEGYSEHPDVEYLT